MSVGTTKGNANCYVKHNFQTALVHIAFYINSKVALENFYYS